MSSASKSLEALSLYKSLLRYSRGLTLTDKAFFRKRIRSEFEASRNLTSQLSPEASVFVPASQQASRPASQPASQSAETDQPASSPASQQACRPATSKRANTTAVSELQLRSERCPGILTSSLEMIFAMDTSVLNGDDGLTGLNKVELEELEDDDDQQVFYRTLSPSPDQRPWSGPKRSRIARPSPPPQAPPSRRPQPAGKKF